MGDLSNDKSFRRKALLYYKRRRYKLAAVAFENYLALNRQDYKARFYLALSMYEAGQYEKCLEQWKILKKMGPKQINVHLNMACAYQNLGRNDLAIRYFKAELFINPISGEALYSLGTLYYNLHKYALAIEYLNRCYSINHSRKQIMHRLAWSYFKTRNLEKEIALYEDWLRIDPKDGLCLNNLGAALMQCGQYAEAQLYLRKALAVNPNDKRAKRNYRKAESLRKANK